MNKEALLELSKSMGFAAGNNPEEFRYVAARAVAMWIHFSMKDIPGLAAENILKEFDNDVMAHVLLLTEGSNVLREIEEKKREV